MRKIFLFLLLFAYLYAILFCVFIIIKPGIPVFDESVVFHYKELIKGEKITQDSQYGYRYPLESSVLLPPANDVLFYEGKQLLKQTAYAKMTQMGKGRFYLSSPGKEENLLYFSATDNSDPRTNGKQYALYRPIGYSSRLMGLIYLSVLSLGLAGIWSCLSKSPTYRPIIEETFRKISVNSLAASPSWKSLVTLTLIAVYSYVFMEWLFFITMPSFMEIFSLVEKLGVFFMAGFALSVTSGLFLAIYAGINFVLQRLKLRRLSIILSPVLPASILTALTLLLIDNFTYTVFKYGIVSTQGIWRGLYSLFVSLLFVYIYTKSYALVNIKAGARPGRLASNISLAIVSCLLLISAIFTLTQVKIFDTDQAEETKYSQNPSKRPNIILMGSDGLSAENMSLYGYTRDTTPKLREWRQTSLVAENAFTNSTQTTGSIVSILTGRPPAETRVLLFSNILTGSGSFQHLVGILRKEGYYTVQIGVPEHVDAYKMNMQNGFDVVNQRSVNAEGVLNVLHELGYANTAYFLSQLSQRITDRLLHIFYIRTMENSYRIVTQPSESQDDRNKVDQLLELFSSTKTPLFVHMHLMGTHGPRYFTNQHIFSKGNPQDKDWMIDFYDDAILDADSYFGEVLDVLDKTGQLNNTIVIIYSDHGRRFTANARIPLMMHFPDNEYAGKIQTNVQNLDIAPTVLDYLGIPQPEWMSGQSILDKDLSNHRLIFSARKRDEIRWDWDMRQLKPPFYQFGYFFVIDCHKWHQINLESLEWQSGEVAGHTAPCNENSLHSFDQIKNALYDYLSSNGFDFSTLP